MGNGQGWLWLVGGAAFVGLAYSLTGGSSGAAAGANTILTSEGERIYDAASTKAILRALQNHGAQDLPVAEVQNLVGILGAALAFDGAYVDTTLPTINAESEVISKINTAMATSKVEIFIRPVSSTVWELLGVAADNHADLIPYYPKLTQAGFVSILRPGQTATSAMA